MPIASHQAEDSAHFAIGTLMRSAVMLLDLVLLEGDVKLTHAIALGLMGWYLMVPTSAPTSGEANAAPSPTTASIWDTYKTLEACEADRHSLQDDPVIGPRMSAARCIAAAEPSPAPKK